MVAPPVSGFRRDRPAAARRARPGATARGPSDAIVLPEKPHREGREIHHESELTLVIGRGGSRIAESDALAHVLGYTIGLDITERGAGDRSRRKSWDTFTPLGPWITTDVDVVVHAVNLE